MKTIYIPCKSKIEVDLSKIKDKLPNKVLLFTTSQYINQIDSMKKQIGASVIKLKDSHATYSGQILGCSKLSNDDFLGYDAILFVGDGLFHPIALSNDLIDVYCYNPKTNNLVKLDSTYFSNVLKKKKKGLNYFYRSKKIGVLISTKTGQGRMSVVELLKKNYPDKEFFFILFDTLEYSRLTDFNFVEMFINTACPRIAVDDDLDKPCLNISDIDGLNYKW